MIDLYNRIKECKICEANLPLGCKPVFTSSVKSKIVIVGQAPGLKVHQSGIPWDDKSGETLRKWLNVSNEQFYDTNLFAIIPMRFCYPGKGKSGDLPPRKECAPAWHAKLLKSIENIELTLLIGKYAQDYYLQLRGKKTLTEAVKNFEEYLPQYLPLPHPSPRNNIWMKKNEWFKEKLLPILSDYIENIIK